METFKLPQQPKNLSNGNKNNTFEEANIMNISAKLQLYSLISFEELIFFRFFSKFSLLVGHQIEKFGQ